LSNKVFPYFFYFSGNPILIHWLIDFSGTPPGMLKKCELLSFFVISEAHEATGSMQK
jgi:hypothetical protein